MLYGNSTGLMLPDFVAQLSYHWTTVVLPVVSAKNMKVFAKNTVMLMIAVIIYVQFVLRIGSRIWLAQQTYVRLRNSD